MDRVYSLPVEYRNEEVEFPLRVIAKGFQTRYIVTVGDLELTYERDDAGELRAIVYDEAQRNSNLPERGLVEAIGSVLRQLLN